MPQINDLERFSFLDSSRFYAAGHWGSLIYYDGKQARNIKNRSGVCFSFLQAFSQTLFFAAFRPYESEGYVEMYKVQYGKREKLFHLYSNIRSAWFYNPDSAIIFGDNNDGQRKVYLYSKGELKAVDRQPIHDFLFQKEAQFYLYKDNRKNYQVYLFFF